MISKFLNRYSLSLRIILVACACTWFFEGNIVKGILNIAVKEKNISTPLKPEYINEIKIILRDNPSLKRIEYFIHHYIRYKEDIDYWNTREYIPSANQVWEHKTEDCDGYAILFKHVADLYNYNTEIVWGIGHAYIIDKNTNVTYLKEEIIDYVIPNHTQINRYEDRFPPVYNYKNNQSINNNLDINQESVAELIHNEKYIQGFKKHFSKELNDKKKSEYLSLIFFITTVLLLTKKNEAIKSL